MKNIKEFLLYISLRFLSIILLVLSLFYLFFQENTHIILVTVLLICGIVLFAIMDKQTKPKWATCLDKSNLILSFVIRLALYISCALIVLAFSFGLEELIVSKEEFFITMIVLTVFSILGYVWCCKRNKNLDELGE